MEAQINKRTNKDTGEVSWVIQKKSCLMHHDQCPSQLKISARELARQNFFVKAVKTGQTSRKQLAEAGRDLHMAMGNVKTWTLYRAKNKVTLLHRSNMRKISRNWNSGWLNSAVSTRNQALANRLTKSRGWHLKGSISCTINLCGPTRNVALGFIVSTRAICTTPSTTECCGCCAHAAPTIRS